MCRIYNSILTSSRCPKTSLFQAQSQNSTGSSDLLLYRKKWVLGLYFLFLAPLIEYPYVWLLIVTYSEVTLSNDRSGSKLNTLCVSPELFDTSLDLHCAPHSIEYTVVVLLVSKAEHLSPLKMLKQSCSTYYLVNTHSWRQSTFWIVWLHSCLIF